MDKYFWLKVGLNIFELIAFVTGVLYWGKVKQSYWKWFVYYCGIVLFTELLAKYIGYGLKNPKLNGDIYFFFGIPAQFVFFFWLFYQCFEKARDRIVPVVGFGVYVAAWFIELLYLKERRMWFSSFSYFIANIILLLLIIIFFLRFVNSNSILNYRRSMMFWVSTGLLLFYLVTLPFYGLRNYLYLNYKQLFYPYWDATYIFGCLMYLFFAFAFIWGRPK